MYFLMPLKIILLEERSFLLDQILYCTNEMAGKVFDLKVGVVKERKIKVNYNYLTATSTLTEVSLLDAVVNATAKVSVLP